jgi:stage III sporulation protein AF
MMEMFQELTRNLVLLLLLATFLEMLLPKSDLTRYIRLVVGLFVLLTILQPVLDLFDWQGNVSLPIREPPQEKVEALINQGIVFGEYQQATALQVAEERLEKQVEAMLHLAAGIDKVKVDLTLANHRDTGPVITQALVLLTPEDWETSGAGTKIQEVETVVIGREQPAPTTLRVEQNVRLNDYAHLVERVTGGVSAYLGIDQSLIQVDLADRRP